MSFFFGFATLVTTAGIAAPLTVIAAAIAIALLGNTLTQFSRSRPSTGSFVTFRSRLHSSSSSSCCWWLSPSPC
jgi:amino acid transporter